MGGADTLLECGILAHGVLRLLCGDCGHDKLVAFSCRRQMRQQRTGSTVSSQMQAKKRATLTDWRVHGRVQVRRVVQRRPTTLEFFP